MRTIALLLACRAFTGCAGRVKTRGGQRQYGSYAGHQYSQIAGNTSLSSLSLAEMEKSESHTQAVVTKPTTGLALLLLAVSDAAGAFAGHRLAPITGHHLPVHRISISVNMVDLIKGPPAQDSGEDSKPTKTVGDFTVPSSPSYIYNSREALDSLNRDIPQALRLESDPRRLAPTNWDVYTDDLVTEVKAGDPIALRLLEALVPSWKRMTKGKREHQRVLEELRTCLKAMRLSKLVENDDVAVMIHKKVDPSTREEVIENRWTAKLPMVRLQPPAWLPPPPFSQAKPRKPDKRIVTIEAISNFHLNARGKVYRHTIDKLNFLVDGKLIDSQKLSKFLKLVALLPLPRLPLPPDNFRK